jgi:hypothetical protein
LGKPLLLPNLVRVMMALRSERWGINKNLEERKGLRQWRRRRRRRRRKRRERMGGGGKREGEVLQSCADNLSSQEFRQQAAGCLVRSLFETPW